MTTNHPESAEVSHQGMGTCRFSHHAMKPSPQATLEAENLGSPLPIFSPHCKSQPPIDMWQEGCYEPALTKEGANRPQIYAGKRSCMNTVMGIMDELSRYKNASIRTLQIQIRATTLFTGQTRAQWPSSVRCRRKGAAVAYFPPFIFIFILFFLFF